MRAKFRSVYLVALVTMIFSACGAEVSDRSEDLGSGARSESGKTADSGLHLVLGKISDDPAGKIREWQPLADHLARSLVGLGVASVQVKIAPDHQTMADWFAAKEVDIFFDNPYSVVYVASRAPSRYLVSRIKTGATEKRAVIFATADSGISSVAELEGRVIALEEPDSASGFVLPVALLQQEGFRVTEKATPEAAVAPGEVGFVFSQDDQNTLYWVISGRVAAGAVDDDALSDHQQSNPGVLVEFATTESVTRNQPSLVGDRIDDQLETAIRERLVEASEGEAARSVLPPDTLRFAILSDADRAALDHLAELAANLP